MGVRGRGGGPRPTCLASRGQESTDGFSGSSALGPAPKVEWPGRGRGRGRPRCAVKGKVSGLREPSRPLLPGLISQALSPPGPRPGALSRNHPPTPPHLAPARRGELDPGGHVRGGTGRSLPRHPGAPGGYPPPPPRPQTRGAAPLGAGCAPNQALRPPPRARGGRSGHGLRSPPWHLREDKASVGRRTGGPAPRAERGARPGEAGGGGGGGGASGAARGASAETCQMPGGRQSALAPHMPASGDGKSQERRRLSPGRALCPTLFFSSALLVPPPYSPPPHTHTPAARPAPRCHV